MIDFEKIFLGHTPGEQRRYLLHALQKLRPHYKRIVVPAVGEFTIPKIAIQAGFKPDEVFASDISLFSSILGCLFSCKKLETLSFQLDDDHAKAYAGYNTDVTRAAFIFWLMKTTQIRDAKTHYESMYHRDIKSQQQKYVEQLATKLRAYISYYSGLAYEIADLRNVIRQEWDSNTIVIVNPPAFAKGYERMFDFDDVLSWNSAIAEFDWKSEYHGLYGESKKSVALFLWYRYQNTQGLPAEDVMFAREYTIERYDYWLCTKPDTLRQFGVKRVASLKRPPACHGLNAKILPPEYQITSATKIGFKQVNQEVALYYRDLWAHKLGNTKAECYFVMFLAPEKKKFEDVLRLIDKKAETLVENLASFEGFKAAVRQIGGKEDIRNISALLSRMAEIVTEYYDLKQIADEYPKEPTPCESQ